jgi:hypothetical protein
VQLIDGGAVIDADICLRLMKISGKEGGGDDLSCFRSRQYRGCWTRLVERAKGEKRINFEPGDREYSILAIRSLKSRNREDNIENIAEWLSGMFDLR